MPIPNPSSGLNPPKPFWPNSIAALYHLFESVHYCIYFQKSVRTCAFVIQLDF
jgi:hypothetical protein